MSNCKTEEKMEFREKEGEDEKYIQYPQKEFAVSGGIFRFSACVLRRYDFFSND